MVVRIKSPHSIQRALNYNERKVQTQSAQCLHAENYLLDVSQMNFYEKLGGLQNLIARNERSKKSNCLHISLNFDSSEKLSAEQMVQIAKGYMEKLGFSSQPYLVYQHFDAAHPHIHILTTNIQNNGKRIDTFNIGRNQSERARKEIEIEFNLVKAKGRNIFQQQEMPYHNVERAKYGKSETRRAISIILNMLLSQYKFTSLAELNVLLKQFNVIADRGEKNSLMFRHGGLYFRLLDMHGNKCGVPIKASRIYSQPTLKNLQKIFEANKEKRQPYKNQLKTSIDWALRKGSRNLKEFTTALQKEKIVTILHQNKDGLIYGITFIDHRSKTVFNGSDLGKEYSIAAIQKRMRPTAVEEFKQEKSPVIELNFDRGLFQSNSKEKNVQQDLLKELLETERVQNNIPYELRKRKKKKRKKDL